MFDASGGAGVVAGKFNQDISKWNTSKVTSIRTMFQNQPEFNQDISTKTVTVSGNTYTAWATLNVTNMSFMLNNANKFNQNIGNWNTAKVTNMSAMLFNTNNFNQNIGSWNVSIVTAFNSTSNFADGIGLSSANYDALLIGWASRAVRPNISISFGTTKRTTASNAAVTTLTSAPNNWTIIDGGLV
jgi:surface protein